MHFQIIFRPHGSKDFQFHKKKNGFKEKQHLEEIFKLCCGQKKINGIFLG